MPSPGEIASDYGIDPHLRFRDVRVGLGRAISSSMGPVDEPTGDHWTVSAQRRGTSLRRCVGVFGTPRRAESNSYSRQAAWGGRSSLDEKPVTERSPLGNAKVPLCRRPRVGVAELSRKERLAWQPQEWKMVVHPCSGSVDPCWSVSPSAAAWARCPSLTKCAEFSSTSKTPGIRARVSNKAQTLKHHTLISVTIYEPCSRMGCRGPSTRFLGPTVGGHHFAGPLGLYTRRMRRRPCCPPSSDKP